MHIAVAGPVDPAGLLEHFYPEDGSKAAASLGDYGTVTTALVDSLLRRGHDVTVVTHRRGFGGMHLRGSRIDFHQVDSRKKARSQALDWWAIERTQMARVLARSGADVVHAQWTYEWALAAMATKLPTVITVHDAPLTVLRHMPDAYRALRATMAYFVRWKGRRSVFTAVSPYVANAWSRQVLFRSPVVVVPNIAPRDLWQSTARSSAPSVLEIANDGRLKNVPRLLEAMALVREEAPNATLNLLGAGLGPGSKMHRIAVLRGLSGGVNFVGPASREEVRDQFSKAWIHCHAALEESFGMTLLEAMVMGVPVIAGADSGATPWLLASGAAGILTDVRSPGRMAADILSLIDDRERAMGLALGGKRQAQAGFSADTVISAYEKLYRQAAFH